MRQRRLTSAEALDQLDMGLSATVARTTSEEPKRAVEELDRIVGWLTYYGWSKVTGAKTLEEIVDSAVRQEVAELRRLFAKSSAEGV